MDWSASLSLTTSHARQHRPNYGSFASAPLKRYASASSISIPESIPEHDCVIQFASPRHKHAELQIIEHYDLPTEDVKANKRFSAAVSSASFSSSSSSTTLTITETADANRLNTFKMLLTSASASSVNGRINGGLHGGSSSAKIHSARAAGEDDATVASSYWLQERERMRLTRERRHLTRNGSPTKAATLRDDDDPETSQYRTAAIMCSVPLLLVIVFALVVLLFGDGSDAVAAAVAPSVLSADAAAPLAPLPRAVASVRLRSAPDAPRTGHP